MRYAYKMNQYNFAYNSVMVKGFESAHTFFNSHVQNFDYLKGSFFDLYMVVKSIYFKMRR